LAQPYIPVLVHTTDPSRTIRNLSFFEKAAYGAGDAASNLIWATITSFLLFYYTDIFGIPAAAVGTLFLFARISDGFVDIAVGAIADRTKTRWGIFRPYLLWFCVPLAAVFVATFTTPDLGVNGKIVYAWVTYNLLMICYTALNIPYGALSAVMTGDPVDRTSLNAFRMAGAQLGALAVNALTFPLIQAFGRGDSAKGYQLTACLFALVAVALFIWAFLATKERIPPLPRQKFNILRDLRLLLSNKPWLLMFLAGGSAVFSVIRSGATLYYCKYYLHFDLASVSLFNLVSLDKISMFLVLGSVGFIVGVLTVTPLVKVFGKKNLFIISLFGCAIVCVGIFFVSADHLVYIFLSQFAAGFIGGVNAPLYFAMIADTADYAEWKFNVRSTGIIFSATSCVNKIGLGIGGALSGYLLSHFGYVAGAAQSAAASQGILLMVSLIPAIGFVLVGLLFFLYPLDESFCRRIRDELESRRQEQTVAEMEKTRIL